MHLRLKNMKENGFKVIGMDRVCSHIKLGSTRVNLSIMLRKGMVNLDTTITLYLKVVGRAIK